MNENEKLARILSDAKRDWTGDESIEDAIKRYYNCRHAEVHDGGEVYIEDPQDGHYLSHDDTLKLIDWMRANRMID